MDDPKKFGPATEVKIFDPRDPSTNLRGAELLDATVVQRDDRWWLYLAGQAHGYGATDLFSASLPSRAPLSATGWTISRDATGELVPLAARTLSHPWVATAGATARPT